MLQNVTASEHNPGVTVRQAGCTSCTQQSYADAVAPKSINRSWGSWSDQSCAGHQQVHISLACPRLEEVVVYREASGQQGVGLKRRIHDSAESTRIYQNGRNPTKFIGIQRKETKTSKPGKMCQRNPNFHQLNCLRNTLNKPNNHWNQ